MKNTMWKKRLASCVGIVVLTTASQAALAANWYVNNAVSTSGNGQSWASAFKNFSNITWSAIKPGDTLYISGRTTSKSIYLASDHWQERHSL